MTKTNEKIHVLADESLGGIKREYVEVDRKAKVGEEIIAIEESLPYFCEGDYGKVISVWCDDVWANFESNYNNKPWFISHERYHVLEPTNIVHIDGPDGTERYEMVDRKAEVDEKIVIIAPDDGLAVDGDIGKIATVTEVFSEEDIDASPMGWVKRSEYRVLIPVESSEEEPQPSDPIDVIANLATRVAELERENKRIKDEIDTLHKDNRRHGEEVAQLEKGVHAQSQRHLYRQQEIERVWERMDRIESEVEALKYAAKETDGKVAHLEADIEEIFPATDAPLVFICRKPGRFEVYQDGKKLHGVMSVRINAKVGEFATHEIEYISGATEEERQ
ncbi:hypothetical protein [Bacillus paralicheniformis]|uniref:hypothetical protein n=1 Tax=Bacillus paralicheniformis TaxID=1648923 RepID=UPI0004713E12|nr:hypothetical protein [Bacillus paralicheniformis]MBG9882770.1 hypothetical protein [Bacillus paralicheniformis]TWJ77738.1 hypothetical protein CHCC20497_2451 [Bacillus paralicheniformis]